MKKFLLLTISIVFTSLLLHGQTTSAVYMKEGQDCVFNTKCEEGLVCYQEGETPENKPIKRCRDRLEVLTQRPSKNEETAQIQNLPNVTIEGGIATAVKAILRAAMLLTIIAIVVSAIYYITSRGKDEDITKAKDILIYLVMGMAIMAAAYGVVAGITQFNVFQ